MSSRAGARAAWRAAWRTFWSRPDAVLLPVAAGVLAWVLAQALVQVWISADITATEPCMRQVGDLFDRTTCAAGAQAQLNALLIGTVVFLFLGQLFWAGAITAALRATGTPVRFRAFAVLGAAFAMAALVLLGFGFGFLPGPVIAFLGQFTMYEVLARGRGPVSGILTSAKLVVTDLRGTLGLAVVGSLALLLGLLLGVVGVFPALALVALAQAHYLQRRITAASPQESTGPVGVQPEDRTVQLVPEVGERRE